MSNLLKKDKGFTLIEIVLVLAIAGLIMVIVFLAVSGAQKSRRDTQRKSDNARMMAQVEQYASNHNGDYGFTTATIQPYVPTSNFNDPSSGNPYTVVKAAALPTCSASNVGTITLTVAGRVVTSRMCLEQAFQDLTNG